MDSSKEKRPLRTPRVWFKKWFRWMWIELIAEYHKVMEEEFISIRCLNCGSEIEQNSLGRKKKYCSIHCKQEWEKIHRKPYTFTCEYCGKEFKSLGVNGRRFCSKECYQKDRFWREKSPSHDAELSVGRLSFSIGQQIDAAK